MKDLTAKKLAIVGNIKFVIKSTVAVINGNWISTVCDMVYQKSLTLPTKNSTFPPF